ncbi:GNAT family N-acetyltransferase [bacterium CPR1]|nr:GNAT family N-acetyltransferase [bacterium CPR1]
MSGWQIERLTDQHEFGKFRCGEHSLDLFLRRYALENDRRGLGSTYVAAAVDSRRVLGYVTVCSSSVQFEVLPEGLNLPRYPLPTLLIARLAVDRSAQGLGIGRALILMVLELAVEISERLGIFAVTVDALNESARKFYLERFGFSELLDDPKHLFITIADVRASLSG